MAEQVIRYLLPFLLFLFSNCLEANDTLTMAQVYNFNVGDTFDYRITSSTTLYYNYSNYSSIIFERDIIVNQWADSVLHIVKHVHVTDTSKVDRLDTLVFTNLGQYAFYSDTTCSTLVLSPVNCYIDTNSQYNGRTVNGNIPNCVDLGYQENRFGSGLGKVFYYSANTFEIGTQEGGNTVNSDSLIYYAKGSERWGTPYYHVNGQTIDHFTPIPETCAVWSDTVVGWENIGRSAVEQIRTSNRIPFEGHTYVEMIYSGYHYLDNYFIEDSLIGYFRNDTANRQTLFYNHLSDSSFFAYHFDQLVDGANCISVDTILLNGEKRVRWTYGQYPFGSSYLQTLQYIEGIGGLNGLVPVYRPCGYLGGVGASPYVCSFGGLTCFSICGQTIYPNDTTASCPAITVIEELAEKTPGVRLFPTMNDGQFQLDLGAGSPCLLVVHDILGREVLNTSVQTGSNFISLTQPKTGLYLWQVVNNRQVILQSGKFVVVSER